MTAHEHSMSDDELDAVLDAAVARLDDALDRTLDPVAGLASLVPANAAQTPSRLPYGGTAPADAPAQARNPDTAPAAPPHSVSTQIACALALIDEFPSGPDALGQMASGQVVSIRQGLEHLDEQLAQRTLSREGARATLQAMNTRLAEASKHLACEAPALVRGESLVSQFAALQHATIATAVICGAGMYVGETTYFGRCVFLACTIAIGAACFVTARWHRLQKSSRRNEAAARQRESLGDLRFCLKQVGTAVEKLFDDAEDWSITPAGAG
ncbi:hypothetical protein [Amycolatopsis sp. VC5-11]|uniref:hypothetical protein n=1 Tax=Amycolatopsis sp. VC5-11 TaxID=3120156 RepID=UPI00300A3F66